MPFTKTTHTAAILGALVVTCSHQAQADVTAEAQLVLTITIEDIFLIDEFDSGFSTYNDNALLSDIGYNSTFFGGGAPGNTPGSVGSNEENETVFFNGLDTFDGDFFAFENSNGPGDTIVITQNVSATASSIDSTYFSQIDSEISISFESFLNDDTERFAFEFTVQAELTGDFELTMPGSALVDAEGLKISAFSDTTLSGDSGEFELFTGENENYYKLTDSTTASGTTPFSETSTGLFIPIDFSNGDQGNTITFHSRLFVNAVTDVPEPSTGLLFAGLALAGLNRRRR